MIKKILIIAAMCSLGFFSASIGRAEGGSSDTFLLTVPLSGPLADMGQSAANGAELALKTWGGGYKMETVDEAGPERSDIDLPKVAVALGYFTESRFTADAPRYLYLKTPVLLPFLTTESAANLGPTQFFRLMPTFAEQGRFMALEILKMKKRPQRILIVTGQGEFQAALTSALTESLAKPPQPSPPVVPETSGKKGSKKTVKLPPPIKPLDPKASVLMASLNDFLTPGAIVELTKAKPDLIILALSISESLTAAPRLAEAGYAKIPVWGGLSMGLREAAAAYVALDIKLSVSLPVDNPLNVSNKSYQDFIQQYLENYHARPTWISALAYDSMMLAIKAASNGSSSAEILTFLAGQSHYSLGSYTLEPGGGGSPPLALMPVNQDSLGFLP